ncbi:MAG: hypothetical protein ABUK01_12290 [Leptospirales bacterium]
MCFRVDVENHPVDELTQKYYQNSATNLAGLYDKEKNGITDLVESVFPDKSGKYFDIGAGGKAGILFHAN